MGLTQVLKFELGAWSLFGFWILDFGISLYPRASMTEPIETLGIIAGDRSLPLVLARQARALGVRKLVAIGFDGQSNRELEPLVDKMVWLKLGQLNKLIDAFHEHGVR